MKPYYEHAGITIYHGDCRDVMVGMSADALCTDPPYGMNLGEHCGADDTRTRELRRGAYASYDDTPDNFALVVVAAVKQALAIVKRGGVFSPAPSAWMLPAPDVLGAVYIPAANGRSPWGFQNISPVLLYGGAPNLNLGAKQTATTARGRAPVELGHPCPKPLEWMTWLVDLVSVSGETVIDPFMGSGTTLVAAKSLGRKAIGIEIEERYCEIAAKRLAQEVLNLDAAGRKAIGIEIEERYCEIAAKRLAQEVLNLDAAGRKAIGIEIEERYCEIAAKRLAQEVLNLDAAGRESRQSNEVGK